MSFGNSKIVRSIFFGFFLVGISFLCTNIAYPQDYDFRHARWGMSMQEVKDVENGEPISEFSKGQVLFYTSTLLDEKVGIAYFFAYNKLVWAKYMLAKYSDSLWRVLFSSFPRPKLALGNFIEDFDIFKKELTAKYGEPLEEKWGIRKDSHDLPNGEESLEVFEKALKRGEGGIFSKWMTDKTKILLIVYGSRGDIAFEIGYYSRELEGLEKKDGL